MKRPSELSASHRFSAFAIKWRVLAAGNNCFFPDRGHLLSLSEACYWRREMMLMNEDDLESWSPYWFPFAIE
ncbi:MAG: hypothetical protein ACREO3_08555, partial [Arenimonas sp.]